MEFARKLSNQRGIDLDIIGRHIRREAADDSRDERLTYVTYQEVRSILASLVVYVRKSNRKGLSIQRLCKAVLRAGF